jgi:hypothetical protein
MNRKQKVSMILAMALALVAVAVFLLAAPLPAAADCQSGQCVYASQCYSQGACIAASCTGDKGQNCESGGVWGICGSCTRGME